ncbi:hypothetical protein [Chondrinema litorale]|uniref:hypothetical protein n=1 Tax=Chondrinema litorale TaxID=2994555 RepID=UPI002542913D|nr:hypothetical protein [Chondrinema litorale]UZR96283.1 hypothetical protein OQ292_21705 [Chondrinema litorale]
MKLKKHHLIVILYFFALNACKQEKHFINENDDLVKFEQVENYFPVFLNDQIADIYVSNAQDEGIWMAAKNLQKDLYSLTGQIPKITRNIDNLGSNPYIIIGAIQTEDIAKLSSELPNKLNNKWEKFIIQGVSDPFELNQPALLIAGSDKRGAIFGIYELVAKMGVSPWHWWADVPVIQQEIITVNTEPYTLEEPKVKYRGIFINVGLTHLS